jgi:hypothetical protein
MITLTYDFEKPETGDKGDVFFPALEDNVQKLNDHTHNGVNSAKITSSSVTTTTQAILAAGWVSQGGGTYRQLVTMSGSLLYNDYFINVKLTSSGHQVFPVIEKVSANTFYVYINDNTLDLTLYYTS